MRRLVALCLVGLACTTAGCTLDFGNTDQPTEETDDPSDLPGDEYRNCVLDTLQQCDDNDLPPNQCTDLIAANCNESSCTPDGDCPPPPDCFTEVFEACIAAGEPPELCALRADLECNPGCTPMDPECECDPAAPDTCDPPLPPDECWQNVFDECVAAGIDPMECAQRAEEVCAPTPCEDPTAPGCCTDPAGCEPPPDCWTTEFEACLATGASVEECIHHADAVCYPEPPPCDDPTAPGCCMDPAGCPPPPDCWTSVFEECILGGEPPELCAERADLVCNPEPPVCEDPMDPACCTDPAGCEWPPLCDDPMDPACWECTPDGSCYPP